MRDSRTVKIIATVVAAAAYLVGVVYMSGLAAGAAGPHTSGPVLALTYLGAVALPAWICGGGIGWLVRDHAFFWGLAVGLPAALDIPVGVYMAIQAGVTGLSWIHYGVNMIAVLLLPAISARLASLFTQMRSGPAN